MSLDTLILYFVFFDIMSKIKWDNNKAIGEYAGNGG